LGTEVPEYRGWKIEKVSPPFLLVYHFRARKGAETLWGRTMDELKRLIDEYEGVEWEGWKIRKRHVEGPLGYYITWVAEYGERRYAFPSLEEAKAWVSQVWPRIRESELSQALYKAGKMEVMERWERRGVRSRDEFAQILRGMRTHSWLDIIIPPLSGYVVKEPYWDPERQQFVDVYGYTSRVVKTVRLLERKIIYLGDSKALRDFYLKKFPEAREDKLLAEREGVEYAVIAPIIDRITEVRTRTSTSPDYIARHVPIPCTVEVNVPREKPIYTKVPERWPGWRRIPAKLKEYFGGAPQALELE